MGETPYLALCPQGVLSLLRLPTSELRVLPGLTCGLFSPLNLVTPIIVKTFH